MIIRIVLLVLVLSLGSTLVLCSEAEIALKELEYQSSINRLVEAGCTNHVECKTLLQKGIHAHMSSGGAITGRSALKLHKEFANMYTATVAAPLGDTTSISVEIMDSYNLYGKSDEVLHSAKLVLCVSHYNENLGWLSTIQRPFIIASKTLIDSRILHVPVNRGNEVSSYLSYIIRFYDVLPESTLFLHGHDEDWHQLYNLRYIVDHLELRKPYESINNYLVDDRNVATNQYMQQLQSLWSELFADELGAFPELGFREKCCAQFVVHRDRIRLRSRHFYQRLYEYVVSDRQDDAQLVDGYHSSMSYVVEFVWHYIFGEPAIMNYEDDIYVKIDDQMRIYL